MDYKDLIGSLPLDVISKVNFFDEAGNSIDKANTLIKDISYPIMTNGYPFLPIIGIRGTYQELNNLETVNFYFGPGGHIIFISCGPKAAGMESYEFKDQRNAIYYWEDTNYGYLIQICEIKN